MSPCKASVMPAFPEASNCRAVLRSAHRLRMCNVMTNGTHQPNPRGALRQRIRESLAAGLLPLSRLGSMVRRGSGRACFICQEVIVPSDLEREVQIGPNGDRPVMVHEACYVLWRVESMTRVAALGRL
jgi:hypothetical protein